MTMTFISFHIRKLKIVELNEITNTLVAFINHSFCEIQLTIYNK